MTRTLSEIADVVDTHCPCNLVEPDAEDCPHWNVGQHTTATDIREAEKRLRQECDEWKSRAEKAEAELTHHSGGGCGLADGHKP